MKHCSRKTCSQVNPQSFSEFYKNNCNSNGLSYACKVCIKEDAKSPKIRANIARYRMSEKGKINAHKYNTSAKGLLSHAKYRQDINNKPRLAANTRKRQAAKLKATPCWLTKVHLELMQMMYKKAAYLTEVTGIKWTVDHIIPLNGKNVRGLHVPWNLRVIPGSENFSKGCNT